MTAGAEELRATHREHLDPTIRNRNNSFRPVFSE